MTKKPNPKPERWIRKNARKETWEDALRTWAAALEGLAEAAEGLAERMDDHAMDPRIDASLLWDTASDLCGSSVEDLRAHAQAFRDAAEDTANALAEDRPLEE